MQGERQVAGPAGRNHQSPAQGIRDMLACEAMAALVSRREGAPVGASGVARECGQRAAGPEQIASSKFSCLVGSKLIGGKASTGIGVLGVG
jgi:hypothetical protein